VVAVAVEAGLLWVSELEPVAELSAALLFDVVLDDQLVVELLSFVLLDVLLVEVQLGVSLVVAGGQAHV
jgi:hypothetical protein